MSRRPKTRPSCAASSCAIRFAAWNTIASRSTSPPSWPSRPRPWPSRASSWAAAAELQLPVDAIHELLLVSDLPLCPVPPTTVFPLPRPDMASPRAYTGPRRAARTGSVDPLVGGQGEHRDRAGVPAEPDGVRAGAELGPGDLSSPPPVPELVPVVIPLYDARSVVSPVCSVR